MSMTPDEYKRWYKEQQRAKQSSNAPAWIGAVVVVCVGLIIGAAVLIDLFPKSADTASPQATQRPLLGNVGGQAPAIIRGANNNNHIVVATPIPGIAQSEAESMAVYATVVAESQPAPIISEPLPLSSAGKPVIDAVQQQQLNFSAEMAAQEAIAEVTNAQATDVASRLPDVSYEDAKALLGRDPCSVPRANPHTCAQGLYKPTPIR